MLAIAIVLTAGRGAWAQPAPVTRADVAATIGWLAVDRGPRQPNSRHNWADSWFATGSAGWYWTDHLKTDVELGAGTKATAYVSRPLTVEGRPAYAFTESSFARRTVGVSQQYQFFRNAGFHPHVAVGAAVSWESITDHVNPIFVYDDTSRTGRVVAPERTDGPRTDVTVRPFVATGFKAYLTQRGYFRSDLRVSFRGRADETLLRFGFGLDF